MLKTAHSFLSNSSPDAYSVSVLQLAIIFLDMEGTPTQEISAIHMNALTRQIVDVYHGHAHSCHDDSWARLHIHGLNTRFLERHGFPDEGALVRNFKDWLRPKDVLSMYANDAKKESNLLDMVIDDLKLPPWSERVYQAYHQMAITYKQDFIPILDKRCCPEAHAM